MWKEVAVVLEASSWKEANCKLHTLGSRSNMVKRRKKEVLLDCDWCL
jgi:hypothetical protein